MSACVYFLLNSYLPKYCANAKAASFPEGSMRPYSSYSTVKMSPVSKFAVVPRISEATWETVISVVQMGSSHFSQSFMTT